MKHLKKILAICLSLLLLFAAVGCSEKQDEYAMGVIQKMKEQMNNVKDVEAETTIGLYAVMDGITMDMNSISTMARTTEPENVKISMRTDASMSAQGEKQEQSTVMDAYFLENNGAPVMYQKVDDSWFRSEMTADEWTAVQQQNNATAELAEMLDAEIMYKKVGNETVNGFETVKIEAKIPPERFTTMMGDVLAAIGLETGTNIIYSKLKETVKVTIWVDEATSNPIRYQADLTTLMQEVIRSLVSDIRGMEIIVNIKSITMQTDFTNFGNVEAIELPAEAEKEAIELVGSEESNDPLAGIVSDLEGAMDK